MTAFQNKAIQLLLVSTIAIAGGISVVARQAQSTPDSLREASTIEQQQIAQRAIETRERLFEGNTAPAVINAGVANAAADHFFEVEVKGEELDRLKVKCVTFHELEGIQVLNAETGEPIPHKVDYGFEEFTITFDDSVPVGNTVRTVIEGSTISGVNTGVFIPYRVFAVSRAFGEMPVGTAVVRTPSTE